MPDYKKALKRKNKFFDEQEAKLVKSVTSLQGSLNDFLNTKLISSLDIDENGVIKSTSANIQFATKVDRYWDTFNKTEATEVSKQFAGDLLKGVDYNIKYYQTFSDNKKKYAEISEGVKSVVQERLGITRAGNLIEDGFIERFVTDEVIKNEIKQATFSAITSGMKLSDFQKQLGLYIKGDNKVLGAFEKHYKKFAYDEYQRTDNITGKLFADKLKLRCAIYQGGLIRDSRDFCRERNGKVFTREEILKFGTSKDEFGGYTNKSDGQFQGKTKPYNPMVDLGGYSCRHRLSWISDTLAIRLRPELEPILREAA